MVGEKKFGYVPWTGKDGRMMWKFLPQVKLWPQRKKTILQWIEKKEEEYRGKQIDKKVWKLVEDNPYKTVKNGCLVCTRGHLYNQSFRGQIDICESHAREMHLIW